MFRNARRRRIVFFLNIIFFYRVPESSVCKLVTNETEKSIKNNNHHRISYVIICKKRSTRVTRQRPLVDVTLFLVEGLKWVTHTHLCSLCKSDRSYFCCFFKRALETMGVFYVTNSMRDVYSKLRISKGLIIERNFSAKRVDNVTIMTTFRVGGT